MLDADEATELELQSEARECERRGIEFLLVSIPDRGVPRSPQPFLSGVRQALLAVRAGSTVFVHCRQGVGRSGMMAVAVAVAGGAELDAAVRLVSESRGVPVPETLAQMAWLEEHKSALINAAV